MLSNLKNFFNFNSTERNGTLVLILLIVLAIVFPKIYSWLRDPTEIDFTAFHKDIEAFEKNLVFDSINTANNQEYDKNNAASSTKQGAGKLFPFDPNGLSAEKWRQLGMQDWQIRIIQKYESKGGKFKKKEDVGKIYGISPQQYKALEPYIELPDFQSRKDTFQTTSNNKIKKGFTERKIQTIDLNLADTNALQELIGIGPAFARRIVKYRELLGGFYSCLQLLEIYGFDQQKFDQIAGNIVIETGPFRMMNLNSISLAELKKHPYMNYALAKAIVDRRTAKGKFTSIAQLKEIPIPTEKYEMIRHYFTIE